MAKGLRKNGSNKVGTPIGVAAVDWLTVIFQAEGDALIGLKLAKHLGGVPLKISRFATTNEGSGAREDDGFQRATQSSKTYGSNETGQNADCGIYYKIEFSAKRLILQFRGEFFTLARSPLERIYKICGALSEALRGCPYYVSRLDVQRMFTGTPSALFPNPGSPRVFFAFLKANDEVRCHMGNYEIQKKSNFKVTLYDKTRELQGRKEDDPYRVAAERSLADAGIASSTPVSRFEIRSIGTNSRICREATALLHSQRLQEEEHLLRLMSLFLETHVVKEAGPRANPKGKTREYMSKRWPASQKWLAFFAVTVKPKKGSTKTYATGNVALRFRPSRPESLLLRFLEASFHAGLNLDEIRRLVDSGARAGMERYVDKLVDLQVGEAFLTGDTVPPAGAVEATGEVVPAEPAGQGYCITLDHDPSASEEESKDSCTGIAKKRLPKKKTSSLNTPRKRRKKLNPFEDKDFEIIRLQSLGNLLDKTAIVDFREALLKRKLQEHGLVKPRRKKRAKRKVQSTRNS